MRLVWTRLALNDRRAIFGYIEHDSPAAAVEVDERISAAISQLREFPESGRIGRIEDTRELVIIRTPYVAAYRVEERTISILRVLHGARMWPDLP